jgi:hypothetical protein
MKRRLSLLVVLGVLAACGSGSAETSPTSDSSTTTDSVLEPDTSDSDTSEPNTSEPDTSEPDTSEPDTSEPDTSENPAPPADGDEVDDVGDTIDPDDDTIEPDDDTIEPDDDTIEPDDDTIMIDDVDDLPAECRQIMGDFLREIEPIVNAVDWENATIASLETFDTTFTDPSDRLDAAMEASGCDRYDFGPESDTSLEFTIELARVEAPGVVAWLEFIRDLDATGVPDGIPTDCEGAIAFVSELIGRTSGMSEVPISQFTGVTSAMSTIQSECPTEQWTAFFEDPAFQAWANG